MIQVSNRAVSERVPLWQAKGRVHLLVVGATSIFQITAGFFLGLSVLGSIVPVKLPQSLAMDLAGMTILSFFVGAVAVVLTPIAMVVGIWSLFSNIDPRVKTTIAYVLAANLLIAVFLVVAALAMGGHFPH